MLKFMIIDDEPIVRDGLKTIIDWESYGYSLCGEGTDGFDGLEKMKRLDPDLVIVDIKMPGMDGLEFIRQAKEKGYKAKFVLLTGYSDFKYTKEAISLGVNSYLLKPVEENELIKTISKIYDEIQEEIRLHDYVEKGRIYIEENMIRSVLRGEPIDSTEEIWPMRLNNSSSVFQIAIIAKIGGSDNTGNDTTVIDKLKSLIRNDRSCLPLEIDERIVIFFNNSDTKRNKRILSEISKLMKDKFKINVLIGLGRSVNQFNEIRLSFCDAVDIIDNKFFYNPSEVVIWEEYNKNKEIIQLEPNIDIAFYIDQLYASIELGDSNKIEKIIDRIFTSARLKRYNEAKVKGLCVNILNEIFRITTKQYPVLANELPANEKIVSEVYDKPCFGDMLKYFTSEIYKLVDLIGNMGTFSVIKKIQTYIESNYDKELTLKMLGDLFGYNSSYLGKAFRIYVGESFNTFLEKVRIDNAKKLLLQGYKIDEIIQMVGFKNKDYFYYKFKKNVGLTTSEYKKSINKLKK